MPKRPHSLGARIRYRFDSSLSAGPISIIRWLAVITFVLIVTAAAVIALARIPTGSDRQGFIQSLWLALTRALDAGTIGNDAEASWRFRAVGLIVTVGGIFIVSALIGLLTTAIDSKLEELRKGKSPVLETGHTLILGWSSKLFNLIAELVVANENQTKPCIVVMAPRDKVEMEDEIRARVGDTGHTRIVCRTGDPANVADLEIVQSDLAKSVIVLSPEVDSPDAQVIRACLALMNSTEDANGSGPVAVAEFIDSKAAKSLKTASQGRVLTVVSTDIIGKITAQVARQSGLSIVYQELLDFEGDEIYFAPAPMLEGKTFADAVLSYDTSSLIGLRHANGSIELCPSMSCPVEPGDMVIGVTADDDTLVPSNLGAHVEMRVAVARPRPIEEAMLVIGWNHMAPLILQQLDHSVIEGSRCHIVYDPRFVEHGIVEPGQTTNLDISISEADTSEPLPIANILASERFGHVIVLCYRHGLSIAESDARTLVTLLQLRQLLEATEGPRVSIVTEMLDVRDVELAKVAHADDFVVSERLTSLLLAQLSENPDLDAVFSEIFDASSPTSISLRPAEAYLEAESGASYVDLVKSFLASDELVIGYRRKLDAERSVEVVVNPPKSTHVEIRAEDQLIVLSKAGRG